MNAIRQDPSHAYGLLPPRWWESDLWRQALGDIVGSARRCSPPAARLVVEGDAMLATAYVTPPDQ